MNYWLLTTEFPPFHGGGISTYCYHTVKMLEKNGNNVTVFVADHSLECKLTSHQEGNVKIIRFHPGNKPYNTYLGYAAALSYEFLETLKAEIEISDKPDFIEVQDYKGIAYYLLHDKKLNASSYFQNIPVVITVHSPSYVVLEHDQAPIYQLPDYWIGEMERWSLTAADILFFPSKYAADAILPGLNRSKYNTHVLFHPFYQEPRPKNNILSSTENRKIYYLGKLTYVKGILQLITYFSYLWDEGFDYPLTLIGDDHTYGARQMSMKAFITKKFKRHVDAGRIRFEGKLPPEQVKQKLENAYLVIISSLFETFSFACAEAMASGKIVLASDSGGQSELIKNGKSGFLYKQGQYESFKEALNEALSLSEEESRVTADNALKFVREELNLERIYQQKIEHLYNYKKQEEGIYPFIQHIEKTKQTSNKPFEKNLLSIIVTYFNAGKYFEETLESLSSVKYEKREVIVVNDGTDDIESINTLYNLQKQFDYKIISQPNKGLPEARNTGANHANGEFLTYLDADDKVDAEYYSKAIKVLKKFENVSYVGCWTKYFGGMDAIWPTYTPEPPYVLLHNSINTSSLVFKRNDFLSAGMNDPEFMYTLEDQESIVNMLAYGYRGVALQEVLFHYRITPTSMSAQFNKVNLLHGYKALSTKHKELYKRYAVEIYNFLNSNGPSYLYDNPTWEPYTDVRKLWDQINVLNKEINSLKVASITEPIDYNNQSERFQSSFSNYNIDHQSAKAELIQSWYNKEYEVLPLWYKRIGHLIKVLQGNRSIKSFYKKRNDG